MNGIHFGLILLLAGVGQSTDSTSKPHIVLVMADDMGWGQTGYRGHPILQTPHLDAMANAGLRFERFYAGAPVCSPTRASVLTGRANDRTGVLAHGYALRQQERTIAQALQRSGYVTGHFGKWHLNGLRGPGAPILDSDDYHPGRFGFDHWVSVTNFYDMDPLMSRNGKIEAFEGDSSEIAVDEAIEFFKQHRDSGRPLLAVIWYGTPHSPFRAFPEDVAPFTDLDQDSAHHHGELVAMDRSIGTLRHALRRLEMADNTLLVFCSDNGGLPRIQPETVGGLRGFKGSVYEGGLRVPGIIEWPGVIQPGITDFPASTMDLFPTIADILDLPDDVFIQPVDGISLRPLFADRSIQRTEPIPFRFGFQGASIDNRYKLLTRDWRKDEFQLYDLVKDPAETQDFGSQHPQRLARMKQQWLAWSQSVDASFAGRDYPEGELNPPDPEPQFWYETSAYAPFFPKWKERWEFRTHLERRGKAKKSPAEEPPAKKTVPKATADQP